MCVTCQRPFGNAHKPYVLGCQHNICKPYVMQNFSEGKISCPVCQWEFSYSNRALITRNDNLLKMILKDRLKLSIQKEILKEESGFIVPVVERVEHTIIKAIKKENERIEEYFKQVESYKNKVLAFNKDLINMVEAY